MSKHQKLWVVIADGEHARIVVPAAAAGSVQTHAGFDAQAAHKRSADLGADRLGRSFESSGNIRHAIAPKHDLKALEKQRFEHFIADRLNEASEHVTFDRLVLVAPARALNKIRERIDQTTARKL